MQRRSDIIFDTEDTGGVMIDNVKDSQQITILLDGTGTPERRAQCRRMLRMFDLGAQYAREEVRKALGVR